MDAVIPTAGRGSRLGELTDDRPKGLVDVAGRPLLAHVFETAVEAGADQLVAVVGYEAAQIVDRFGDAFEGVLTAGNVYSDSVSTTSSTVNKPRLSLSSAAPSSDDANPLRLNSAYS